MNSKKSQRSYTLEENRTMAVISMRQSMNTIKKTRLIPHQLEDLSNIRTPHSNMPRLSQTILIEVIMLSNTPQVQANPTLLSPTVNQTINSLRRTHSSSMSKCSVKISPSTLLLRTRMFKRKSRRSRSKELLRVRNHSRSKRSRPQLNLRSLRDHISRLWRKSCKRLLKSLQRNWEKSSE